MQNNQSNILFPRSEACQHWVDNYLLMWPYVLRAEDRVYSKYNIDHEHRPLFNDVFVHPLLVVDSICMTCSIRETQDGRVLAILFACAKRKVQ